jgi:hypothetical protein
MCGYTGREVPIRGTGEHHETVAAFAAADAWNIDSRRQAAARRQDVRRLH